MLRSAELITETRRNIVLTWTRRLGLRALWVDVILVAAALWLYFRPHSGGALDLSLSHVVSLAIFSYFWFSAGTSLLIARIMNVVSMQRLSLLSMLGGWGLYTATAVINMSIWSSASILGLVMVFLSGWAYWFRR